MIHLITGGSASGKSAYAEMRAMEAGYPRYYIATMEPFGEEGRKRIEKHRAMRAGKGFTTIECCHHLGQIRLPGSYAPSVLLECVTNLTANEQFSAGGSDDEIIKRVLDGIMHLAGQAKTLILVTGEVGMDGICYEEDTRRYQYLLERINQELGAMADQVTEVVYGIPVRYKLPADMKETGKETGWQTENQEKEGVIGK